MSSVNHGGYRPGAGRPKGAKNRLSESRERLAALFAAKGYDPVESLIAIAQDPATEPKLKANIAKELLNYIAPRQKASETRIEEDKTVTVMIQSYSERQAGALEQGPVVDVLGQGCC